MYPEILREMIQKYGLFIFTLFLIGCSAILDPEEPAGDIVVVLTFDDVHYSIFQNAYPVMREFNFPGTNYVNTGAVDTKDHLTLKQLRILEDEGGWETGGHTISHANLPQIELDEAEEEIRGSWQYLKDNGLSHSTFALPKGHANQANIKIVKKYFNSIRGSEDFKVRCPIDPNSLGYYDARNTDGSEKIISRILRGITHHECLVIIGFHRIVPNKESHSRAINPREFREVLEFIRRRGLKVLTLSQALELKI